MSKTLLHCFPRGSAWAVCAVLFAVPAFGQNYDFNAIPLALLNNANAVVRLSETTFSIENDREATETRTFAITILNAQGKFENRAEEYENQFQEVRLMKGRLFDAAGRLVRESDKNDVRTFSASDQLGYNDALLKVLEMDYNALPYTVEFKTKIFHKDFLPARHFDLQKLGHSVQQVALNIETPPDYRFRWKGYNNGLQPLQQNEDDKVVWRWMASDLPARPSEPYAPYFQDEFSQIVFAPEQMRMGEYTGASRDWVQVGQFFYKLNDGRDELSQALLLQVRQMTEGKPRREKIKILYRYLQQNYRYVSIQIGIGGWQSFPASFVEQKKYGDCKALTNFMKAMLKAVGVESHQAIVYAGSLGAPVLLEDLPAPRFNHVVLYVPAEKMWLECTSNNNPPGYLGNFTADRQALLLTPTGGEMVRTPKLALWENHFGTSTDVSLDERGYANIQSHQVAVGEPHDRLRDLATQKRQAEIERDFVENAPFGVGKVNLLQVAAADSKPEAGVNYHVETNNYAQRSGKRIFVPLNKSNPFRRSLPPDERRQLELRLRETYVLDDTIRIHCPPNFVTENVPTSTHLESPYGRYDLTVEQSPTQVRIIRHIEILPVSETATRYEDVRRFYANVAKADAAQMVLVQQE